MAVAAYLFVVAMIRFVILEPGEPVLVDSVRLAGDALVRRSALPGRAGYRRPAGTSFQGWRAQDGGHPGAAGSPRISRRALRRCTGSPRRSARLAGNVRAACEHRRADPRARPFFFTRPGSSVVRVAAAWPVAAGARGSPAAVRAGAALARQGRAGIRFRKSVYRNEHAAGHGRL